MADLKALAEQIVGLTLLEAQELKTILKDEYGIEPAAGGAVMVAGPAAGGDAAAEEEKTEFDVILKSAGDKKINVIKEVLAAEGRGTNALAEHAAIVDAIARRDEAAADKALREHISVAFVTRLKLDSRKTA